DEAAQHFDRVVVGEAEDLCPIVRPDIQTGTGPRIYRQIPPADLAGRPWPRRDLTTANRRHYVTVNAVQTSRGCRHACRYCSITAFHHAQHHTRPLDEVVAELRTLPRHLMFIDDNIIADPD